MAQMRAVGGFLAGAAICVGLSAAAWVALRLAGPQLAPPERVETAIPIAPAPHAGTAPPAFSHASAATVSRAAAPARPPLSTGEAAPGYLSAVAPDTTPRDHALADELRARGKPLLGLAIQVEGDDIDLAALPGPLSLVVPHARADLVAPARAAGHEVVTPETVGARPLMTVPAEANAIAVFSFLRAAAARAVEEGEAVALLPATPGALRALTRWAAVEDRATPAPIGALAHEGGS